MTDSPIKIFLTLERGEREESNASNERYYMIQTTFSHFSFELEKLSHFHTRLERLLECTPPQPQKDLSGYTERNDLDPRHFRSVYAIEWTAGEISAIKDACHAFQRYGIHWYATGSAHTTSLWSSISSKLSHLAVFQRDVRGAEIIHTCMLKVWDEAVRILIEEQKSFKSCIRGEYCGVNSTNREYYTSQLRQIRQFRHSCGIWRNRIKRSSLWFKAWVDMNSDAFCALENVLRQAGYRGMTFEIDRSTSKIYVLNARVDADITVQIGLKALPFV